MNEQERYAAVAACKWVDEVVPDAPYQTSLECMDLHNCDICVHGDDITTMADGSDCYSFAKKAGRYKEFKRTQGVSTTELVGRMLKMTTERSTPVSLVSPFLITSTRLSQFSNGKEPKPTDRVVYVHGAFDLFHVGHIEFLKAAKSRGDFLIVGVHDDETVNYCMGSSFPVMTVHERALSVLQCRYVDEVIISAPHVVSEEVLSKVAKVSVVCHALGVPYALDVNGVDPFKVPKALGIFEEIEFLLSNMTTQTVIDRITVNRAMYEARQAKKLGKAVVEAELLKKEKVSSSL
ncbi:UNVERIFIED_CONTAM: Ethanolamine-phosphate cytidylyltransferase [Siphonaria sp. JEL0065]|nr:Ethanolamine-phosphate cytidylyltransferase [Siphonaria sp. JEL0065]